MATKGPISVENSHVQPPPAYDLAAEASPPAPAYSEASEQLLDRNVTKTESSSRLRKPIAIPATSKKMGSPFLRAYPPTLESYGLTKEVFLPMIDELNRVAVGSPPLKVLGLAGSIVGMVPIHEAQIVGNSVEAGMNLAARAISKGRTEWFLRQKNKEVFAPRGLKIEIAKLSALAKLAHIPILDEKNKVDKKAKILEPLKSSDRDLETSGQDRRLRSLEQWIAQLDVEELPSVEKRKNPLSQMNVFASEHQRGSEEKGLMKTRSKAFDKYDKKVAKAERVREKRMKKAEKKMEKLDLEDRPEYAESELAKRPDKIERLHEKRLRKAEKVLGKKDRENKRVRKVLWLVIRNIDDGNEQGFNPYLQEPVENEQGKTPVLEISAKPMSSSSGSDSSSNEDSDSSEDENHYEKVEHQQDVKAKS